MTLAFDASYMHDEQKMLAWLFLNHLVALITVEAMTMIEQKPLKGSLSWDDMRHALAMVQAVHAGGHWQIVPPNVDAVRICERLGIELYDLGILTEKG